MLFGLTNHGRPFIYVKDGNYRNRGELLLEHRWEGLDLKDDEAHQVLENLYTLWSRPVHIETKTETGGLLLSFDGSEHASEEIGAVMV